MKRKNFTLTILFTFISCLAFSQPTNLIVNGGAEEDPVANGWTIVTAGTNCYGGTNWRIEGGHDGYPPALEGTHYFTSGCGNVSGKVYQDVDVSSMAAGIDAGEVGFNFSAWLQNYNQSPPDQGRIIVSYFSTDMDTLAKYDTGPVASPSVWTRYSNYTVAPAGTRTIRVTLQSIAINGGAVDAYFDNIELFVVDVLPVTLEFFRARAEGSQVRTTWQTSSESNSDYFELERSADGTSWSPAGRVQAAGNASTTRNYSLVDASPYQGISYYRLKHVDKDGKVALSTVESVSVTAASNAFRVYPNPARSVLHIEGPANSLSHFRVFNAAGADVTTLVRISNAGNTGVKADVSKLSSGTYFIKTRDASISFYKQ